MSVKKRGELNEALNIINKQLQFDDAHLGLITDETSESLFKFIEKHFLSDEVLTKSLGLVVDQEVMDCLKQTLPGNLSIVLVSDISHEIIACKGIAIGRRGHSMDLSASNNDKLKTMLDFVFPEQKKNAIYDYYNIDTCVESFFLGTHREHRKQGIASKMMQAVLLFCRHLGLDQVCIEGCTTSNFSQRVYKKHGFETIRTYIYEEYVIDGEIVFKNTSEHKSTKVYFKKLN